MVHTKNYLILIKNIFEAIQNDSKSVLQAWTEVCHQIFGGWKVQTMWNLQKWCVWRSMLKGKKWLQMSSMALSLSAQVEVSMEWKHADSPVKKNFKTLGSVKKVRLAVFWDMKVSRTIDFFEKDAFVNFGKIYLIYWMTRIFFRWTSKKNYGIWILAEILNNFKLRTMV